MALVRMMLGICAIVVMALFMWGLRSFLFAMDREFVLGFGAGFFFLFALLWVHHKATGKNIFTEG